MVDSEDPVNPEICLGAKVKTDDGRAGIVEYFYEKDVAAVNIKGETEKIHVENLEVIR